MFAIIGDRSKAASDSQKNLCLTCRSYRAITYALDDREERLCVNVESHPLRLRGPVSRCTDYIDKTQPDKWEMEKMAWIIEASKRKTGFTELMNVTFIPPSKQKND